MIITKTVLKPKEVPRTKKDNNNKGTDIHKVITETGIWVTVESIIDIPVMPPGAKPVKINIQLTASALNILEATSHTKSIIKFWISCCLFILRLLKVELFCCSIN